MDAEQVKPQLTQQDLTHDGQETTMDMPQTVESSMDPAKRQQASIQSDKNGTKRFKQRHNSQVRAAMQTIDGAYNSQVSNKTQKRSQLATDKASDAQISLTTPTSQITAVPRSHIANDNSKQGSQEMLMDQAMLRTMQNKSPSSTAYSTKSNILKKKKYSNNLSHNYGGQFQMFNASGAMIPTVSQSSTTAVSKRSRSKQRGISNRIKNSNSQVLIQQQRNVTAQNHDSKQLLRNGSSRRPPKMPHAVNRLNLQSADPRKIHGKRNQMIYNRSGLGNVSTHEGNTDEFVSAELNTGGANSNLNQIGHDNVRLETQSRDEIFQVNNLIKNSQIQVDDKKIDSRSQGNRGRNIQGSELQLNSFLGQEDKENQIFVNSQQLEKNSITNRSNRRREGKYLMRQRNNSMLPSNFQLTNKIQQDLPKTACPTGPADYNIERIIGTQMAQSSIKNEPGYSFSKSMTHRTTDSTGTSNNKRTFRKGNDQNQFAIGNFYGSPPRGTGRDSLMIFHRTNDTCNPGVGDYNLAQTHINLLSKSPKATIGNEQRFKKPKLKEFVPHVPHQYMLNASKMQAKPPKMGTFGNENRFNHGKMKQTPGVGDYDLTNFKNFAKASETQFEIPKYQKVPGRSLNGHHRARSAVNRTIDYLQSSQQQRPLENKYINNNSTYNNSKQGNAAFLSQSDSKPLRTARSRSPASLMGIQIGKRLGGPSSANQNFIMQASREQRRKLFTHESESAQMNTIGPGPAKYLKEHADRQRFGEKDRFSIPQASRGIGLKAANIQVPITHTAPVTEMKLKLKKNANACIGTYKQRFNVEQMNPIHSNLWKKGIIFY